MSSRHLSRWVLLVAARQCAVEFSPLLRWRLSSLGGASVNHGGRLCRPRCGDTVGHRLPALSVHAVHRVGKRPRRESKSIGSGHLAASVQTPRRLVLIELALARTPCPRGV